MKAVQALGQDLFEQPDAFQELLRLLRNVNQPAPVRLRALQTLQAASFRVVRFNPFRSEYLAALRSVAADPDLELRQRVLGLLSREQDGYAQQLLLTGLEQPDKALLPPEKALQLLGNDIHADAYAVARTIVQKPPNAAAKREAMRLLAADAASVPMFERVLTDKKESPDVRQLSASVLRGLAPHSLRDRARAMLLDETEHPDVQAMSLTALTQFGDPSAVENDTALHNRVDRLKRSSSRAVKQGVQQFLSKYRR